MLCARGWPWLLLWHCGWCRPLRWWQRALRHVGVEYTTGVCPRCAALLRARWADG